MASKTKRLILTTGTIQGYVEYYFDNSQFYKDLDDFVLSIPEHLKDNVKTCIEALRKKENLVIDKENNLDWLSVVEKKKIELTFDSNIEKISSVLDRKIDYIKELIEEDIKNISFYEKILKSYMDLNR